ncbi:unnamed protein product, partial [Ectocarpus fasciculatus]
MFLHLSAQNPCDMGTAGRRPRRGEYRRIGRNAALFVGVNVLKMVAASSAFDECDSARRAACETAFLDCKLSTPASNKDGIC